jgi:HK97 family phage prohead protease
MNPPEATEVEEESDMDGRGLRFVNDVELRDNPSLIAELRSGAEGIAERRHALTKAEVRSNPDGSWTLVGHAAVFDSNADLGQFTESIQRGAFRRILNQDGLDVRALFNHDPDLVLGRTPGTLTLREDPTGLAYEVNVAPTTAGNDLRVLLERGDVTRSSFAFQVGKQEWRDMPDGTLHRTITDFKDLLDVSPVTYPAYPGRDGRRSQ